jgi:hypothetical protein
MFCGIFEYDRLKRTLLRSREAWALRPGDPRHTDIVRTAGITNQKSLPCWIPSRVSMALIIKIELRCSSTLRRNFRRPNCCRLVSESIFMLDENVQNSRG